jgi:hypothetical protein
MALSWNSLLKSSMSLYFYSTSMAGAHRICPLIAVMAAYKSCSAFVMCVLECKLGGLIVISCHNKIRDELSDLAASNKATLFPSAVVVCDKPTRIQTCCCTIEPKVAPELQEKPLNGLFRNKDLPWWHSNPWSLG